MMTSDEVRLVDILQLHKGRGNAIKGRALAYEIFGICSDTSLPVAKMRYSGYERQLRLLVHDVIFDFGIPVIADVNGYYLVEKIEEVEAAANTLRKHGIAELVHAAMLKKVSPAELIGQLVLEFPEGEESDGLDGSDVSDGVPKLPSHLVAITSMLERYRQNPEKYAEEIRVLQEKYSPFFISRDAVSGLDQAMETLRQIREKVV
jgi:hypothetical protein